MLFRDSFLGLAGFARWNRDERDRCVCVGYIYIFNLLKQHVLLFLGIMIMIAGWYITQNYRVPHSERFLGNSRLGKYVHVSSCFQICPDRTYCVFSSHFGVRSVRQLHTESAFRSQFQLEVESYVKKAGAPWCAKKLGFELGSALLMSAPGVISSWKKHL